MSEQKTRSSFLNLSFDHVTLLLAPHLYRVYHLVFQILFGDDIVYHKRKQWTPVSSEKSLTFALRIGSDKPHENATFKNSVLAVVQPTEPFLASSHVRAMLEQHSTSALIQHIALRTDDLLTLYTHLSDRGVNFITPILDDAEENLLQVFTGELFFSPDISPGPSAVFFEFVQRHADSAFRKRLTENNRETFFRDTTFLGLYEVKEREYQIGRVKPFMDEKLFRRVDAIVGTREPWEIQSKDLEEVENAMLDYVREQRKQKQP